MRQLDNGLHEIWYYDGSTKLSKTLKQLSKEVKRHEEAGHFVQSAIVQDYTENGTVYYTGLIVVVTA